MSGKNKTLSCKNHVNTCAAELASAEKNLSSGKKNPELRYTAITGTKAFATLRSVASSSCMQGLVREIRP